jgi:tetratricopeptide (TPR) repeat protein
MGLTGLYLTQGRIGMARDQARSAIELAKSLGEPGWEKMSHLNMAFLDRLSGNLTDAIREAELACQDYEKTGIYDLEAIHLRALITLEMGRMDEFEKQLGEIKQLITREQYPKLMRAYYHLLGQRELQKNDIDKAIDYFWKALKLLPSRLGKSNADADSARYYHSLADAYFRAGAYPRALDMYEKVPPYWEQRFNSGDIYARAFCGRAKAHELYSERAGLTEAQRRGERLKAAESYRKFLSLWGQADPLLASEVVDAKKRLAALEAE